jgi:protein PhnA
MSTMPACPQCHSDVTYEDGASFVCAECAHEWSKATAAAAPESGAKVFHDSNGNPLADGDSVVVIKDLKVKGASSALKAGTKVKNIRLVDGDHDIDCRIDGFGAMKLKSEFVKKACTPHPLACRCRVSPPPGPPPASLPPHPELQATTSQGNSSEANWTWAPTSKPDGAAPPDGVGSSPAVRLAVVMDIVIVPPVVPAANEPGLKLTMPAPRPAPGIRAESSRVA